ncbi:hypothetical protein THASP1DRAFT_25257 [Thamnocephalis sphaerospora]|uniref:Uncharacterized protein n=1 Tax=Thamnocephalis sphaerospora TaxID=78915 RepID=A0A4P9XKT2_9FUNG|nr:hypothetical protein THASP1DRAFT_25257 [Thamnocephalis sphaerospora]|eukprot:RKP06418.1 hypothetical protein THASP1DRAFT_25257 [Thamnocephalis sphaerospora]
MTSTSAHVRLDALWHVMQRRSYSRFELDQLRSALRDEISRLVRETERQRETVAMLRWRSRKQIRAFRQLEATLDKERAARAAETAHWEGLVTQLRAECEHARSRADTLALESGRRQTRSTEAALEGASRRTALSISTRAQNDLRSSAMLHETPTRRLLSEYPLSPPRSPDQRFLRPPSRHQALSGQLRHRSSSTVAIPSCLRHQHTADVITDDDDAENANAMLARSLSGAEMQRGFLAESDVVAAEAGSEKRLHVCHIPKVEFDEMLAVHNKHGSGTSEELQQSLARTMRDVQAILQERQSALSDLNSCIRQNRALLRDARRDLVSLQSQVTLEETQLDQIQQRMRSHMTESDSANVSLFPWLV